MSQPIDRPRLRDAALACTALWLTLAACGGDGSPSKTTEAGCQPFEIEGAPIELGTVLGAGRDRNGTLYVVDEHGDTVRAFVGSQLSLTRLSVTGSGRSSGDGLQRDELMIDARPRGYRLIVERDASSVRMARTLELDARGAAIADLPESSWLEPVEPSALDGAELRDLPAEIAVEYLAELPDGELLLVLRPAQAGGLDYDAFRVFYGTEEALIERQRVKVTRARDGGSTHVVFTLDGATADAYFPIESDGMGFVPGPATLEHGGASTPLELLDPAAHAELLAGMRFECLE